MDAMEKINDLVSRGMISSATVVLANNIHLLGKKEIKEANLIIRSASSCRTRPGADPSVRPGKKFCSAFIRTQSR